MRVTILTSEYPPHVYGGVGVHLRYLTEAMKGSVDLDVRYFGSEDRDEEGLSVRHFIPWSVAQTADDPKLAKALAPLSTDIAMVSTALRSDVVHAHTWYTLFAGFLARTLYGIPLVVTVHSLEPRRTWKQEQLGRGYYLSSWMEKMGIENADRVIAVSGEMRDDIIELFDVDPDRVVVVYNGIDLEKYRPRTDVDVRSRYGISGRFVLFVGRISRQKGIDVLLKASPELDADTTLVLAATSPDTRELEKEVTDLVASSDRVVWINEMVDEDALINLYTAADAFVCPSIYEPFGIINLEAMACETPVVASATGGIKEVVNHGETGLLVEPDDPAALARAVNQVMGDEELRKDYAAAGRRRVEEQFSWSSIARQTLEVYAAAASADL